MTRVLHAMMTWLVRLTGLLAVAAAATYGLALVALTDMEQPPVAALPGSLAGKQAVGAGSTGSAQVWDGLAPVVASSGLAAPVVSASLVENGGALVTSALDGSVRLADVNAGARLGAAGMPALRAAIYDRLWKPYGAPVAQDALWLTAQVLPLNVPETLKGQRGHVFRDCADCPEMVEIGPGGFFMGSPWTEKGHREDEGPRHWVTISKPFAVGRFTVTFAEWDACVAAGGCNGYKPADEGWGRDRRPLINVSWDDAKSYIDWLSKKSGQAYRLLTEAEWEYAARAGTTTAYSWGYMISKEKAQYSEGEVARAKQSTNVGSFPANAFGLHDVHGNVWQWVEDCYVDTYKVARADGAAQTTKDCRSRVLRGGSWSSTPQNLRSALRGNIQPDGRLNFLGFRLARTLTP